MQAFKLGCSELGSWSAPTNSLDQRAGFPTVLQDQPPKQDLCETTCKAEDGTVRLLTDSTLSRLV